MHDVKRAIISTSATAPSGIETHLDEWDPQRGRTVSYSKKRTSGGTRWLNIMARGGLFFLRRPEWRTSGECAPLDGDHQMAPAEVAAGAASAEVSAGADQEMAPEEVAAGAASVK